MDHDPRSQREVPANLIGAGADLTGHGAVAVQVANEVAEAVHDAAPFGCGRAPERGGIERQVRGRERGDELLEDETDPVPVRLVEQLLLQPGLDGPREREIELENDAQQPALSPQPVLETEVAGHGAEFGNHCPGCGAPRRRRRHNGAPPPRARR